MQDSKQIIVYDRSFYDSVGISSRSKIQRNNKNVSCDLVLTDLVLFGGGYPLHHVITFQCIVR